MGAVLSEFFCRFPPLWFIILIGGITMSKKAVKVTAIVIAAIFLIGICSGIAASFLF